MERDRFRRLVLRALASLPPEFRGYLANVDIVIHREPDAEELRSVDFEDGGDLFGLYVGTPLTERANYNLTLPDRIVIYQGPLERHFHPRDIPHEVRQTVMHELAHHFGIDDERLHDLGLD